MLLILFCLLGGCTAAYAMHNTTARCGAAPHCPRIFSFFFVQVAKALERPYIQYALNTTTGRIQFGRLDLVKYLLDTLLQNRDEARLAFEQARDQWPAEGMNVVDTALAQLSKGGAWCQRIFDAENGQALLEPFVQRGRLVPLALLPNKAGSTGTTATAGITSRHGYQLLWAHAGPIAPCLFFVTGGRMPRNMPICAA
jgi:hypothetical protein